MIAILIKKGPDMSAIFPFVLESRDYVKKIPIHDFYLSLFAQELKEDNIIVHRFSKNWLIFDHGPWLTVSKSPAEQK